jgi:putative NIF3 family GTP cyclohydrolase 1 type 2
MSLEYGMMKLQIITLGHYIEYIMVILLLKYLEFSSPSENEYQEHFLGVKTAGA